MHAGRGKRDEPRKFRCLKENDVEALASKDGCGIASARTTPDDEDLGMLQGEGVRENERGTGIDGPWAFRRMAWRGVIRDRWKETGRAMQTGEAEYMYKHQTGY